VKLTKQIVEVGTGCNPSIAAIWLPSIQTACDRFSINTPNRVAAFLANLGVESNGLQALVEDLDYSAPGLARTWPYRYAEIPTATVKMPNATAWSIARNPKAIANDVYANRMGNGAQATGDGWEYRGEGPIQLTGKSVIESFFTAMDLPKETDPESLQKPALGSMSAAWFFSVYADCNCDADNGEIGMVIERINGQSPCSSNKGPLRESRYRAVLGLFNV
jgi:putative chitinase